MKPDEGKTHMTEETNITTTGEPSPPEERPYWETLDYRATNQIIHGNLDTTRKALVTMGYYLKRVRDERMYEEGGYTSFGAYVKGELDISESTASRSISIMEQFSEGGNSPKLAEEWQEYSLSALQEILYLTGEQREAVTPEMTVREIREIRRPAAVEEQAPDLDPGAEMDLVALDEAEEIVSEAVSEPIVVAVDLPGDEAQQDLQQEEPLVIEGDVAELLPEEPVLAMSQDAELDDRENILRILDSMIGDVEYELQVMGDYWQERQPDTYLRKTLQIEAYKLLREKYEREEGLSE